VINALVLAIEAAIMPKDSGGISSPFAMGLDLILGSMLVADRGRVLAWVQVRVILGGILITGLQAAKGEILLAGFQLAFSVALLMLVLGDAGKLRIAAGALVTLSCLALEGLGLAATATGRNPLTEIALTATSESEPARVLEGTRVRYTLTLPNDRWRSRKREVVKREAPAADRWVVRPDRDAHVLVIAERVEGEVEMTRFRDVAVENLRKEATSFEIVEEGPLSTPSNATTAYLIHNRRAVAGVTVEGYHALFILDGNIYQVFAFTTQAGFEDMSAELRKVIEDFKVRTSPLL